MSNQDNKKKVLSRRDFLKTIGAAGVATTGTVGVRGWRERRDIDGSSRRNPYGSDDLPDESDIGRQGVVAGVRHDASALCRRP